MKLLKKHGYKGTIRKVTDNKRIAITGIIGTVGDLIDAEIFEDCNCPREMWAYVPNDKMIKVKFAKTREEVVAEAKKDLDGFMSWIIN